MAFAFGGMFVVAAESGHKWWLRRQEQLPRFQKVQAVVLDKGLRSDNRRWIRFTCRVGAHEVDGARLTSSGSDAGWEAFEKGREYGAFWAPGLEECVLLVDEEVQSVNPELRASRQLAGVCGGVSAALALAAYGLARVGRRPAAAEQRVDGWLSRAMAPGTGAGGGLGEA